MRWRGRALVLAAAVAAACTSAPTTTSSGPPVTSASPSATGQAPRIRGAWPTYHADPARSGVGAGPSLGDVRHAWTSPTLDGDVYAEPLVVGARLYAATENDTVYALDVATGAVVWKAHLGEPVQSSTLPCGNIDPVSGITSTPVVDPAAGVIYAAAFLAPARHELFAVGLADGQVVWHRPIDPPGMDPRTQQLRSALALANGRVYAAYGGLFGDCGQYHGWVAAVRADGSGPLIDYQAPTVNAGGIWAPSGPSVDEHGDVYVTTGNAFSGATFDHGDSVIRLTPDLREVGFFAPSNWPDLNAGDIDLGSVGPAILPGDRVFQIGKEGVGYLLDAADLGGIGGELSSVDVCEGATYGGTAHTDDTVFVPCPDGVVALGFGGDDLSVAWRSEPFDAGPPIVAGGLVWAVDLGESALVGLDQGTGSRGVRIPLEDASHFASPSSAPGCLFVPTRTTITAFCVPGAP
jgi:outer membrane protein assembly factor BamB